MVQTGEPPVFASTAVQVIAASAAQPCLPDASKPAKMQNRGQSMSGFMAGLFYLFKQVKFDLNSLTQQPSPEFSLLQNVTIGGGAQPGGEGSRKLAMYRLWRCWRDAVLGATSAVWQATQAIRNDAMRPSVTSETVLLQFLTP